MIEKNIPIPPKKSTANTKYDFVNMEPGDSVLITEDVENAHAAARVHAYKSRKRGIHKTFTARTQPDGSVRIWRLE